MNNTNSNIIVSLTSFPPRIAKIHITINSLLAQTVKADKIVLYLNKDEFKNWKIPEELQKCIDNGLEIRWVKGDYKSFNKLYHALKDFPNSNIITVDDDRIYSKNLIKKLLRIHKKFPNSIVANIMHKAGLNYKLKTIYNYSSNKWGKHVDNWFWNHSKPKNYFFAQGAGGVLYPPSTFNETFFKNELFMDLCPKADDIWFWAMAVLNHKTTVCGCFHHSAKEVYKDGSPSRLATLNGKRNKDGETLNDLQLKAIIKKFPEIVDILFNEK